MFANFYHNIVICQFLFYVHFFCQKIDTYFNHLKLLRIVMVLLLKGNARISSSFLKTAALFSILWNPRSHTNWWTMFRWHGKSIQCDYLCLSSLKNEGPIHLLYPMELHYELKSTTSNIQDGKTVLNVNAEEFQPKRSAAAVAEILQTMKTKLKLFLFLVFYRF